MDSEKSVVASSLLPGADSRENTNRQIDSNATPSLPQRCETAGKENQIHVRSFPPSRNLSIASETTGLVRRGKMRTATIRVK